MFLNPQPSRLLWWTWPTRALTWVVRMNPCRKCRVTFVLITVINFGFCQPEVERANNNTRQTLFFNHEFSLMLSQTSYLWSSLLCIFYVTTRSGGPQEKFPGASLCPCPHISKVSRHFCIDLALPSHVTSFQFLLAT